MADDETRDSRKTASKTERYIGGSLRRVIETAITTAHKHSFAHNNIANLSSSKIVSDDHSKLFIDGIGGVQEIARQKRIGR